MSFSAVSADAPVTVIPNFYRSYMTTGQIAAFKSLRFVDEMHTGSLSDLMDLDVSSQPTLNAIKELEEIYASQNILNGIAKPLCITMLDCCVMCHDDMRTFLEDLGELNNVILLMSNVARVEISYKFQHPERYPGMDFGQLRSNVMAVWEFDPVTGIQCPTPIKGITRLLIDEAFEACCWEYREYRAKLGNLNGLRFNPNEVNDDHQLAMLKWFCEMLRFLGVIVTRDKGLLAKAPFGKYVDFYCATPEDFD